MKLLSALVLLVLLWVAALVGVDWLGLAAWEPRITDAPPRLVLTSGTAQKLDVPELRSSLREAGMDPHGADWWLEGAENEAAAAGRGRHAVEVRAEDARSIGRLPGSVRIERLGGDAVLVLTIPDRGEATRRLALPVLDARLAKHARRIGAEVTSRRRRDAGDTIELQWVLARHPRGRSAPDARRPRLQAPQLASERGAARRGG